MCFAELLFEWYWCPVLATTNSTELAHVKNAMAGMIGITASIPTTTTRDDFLSLWASQTASDNKFAPIRAAGGQLNDADFSLPPADLHVYYAYVSAVDAIVI